MRACAPSRGCKARPADVARTHRKRMGFTIDVKPDNDVARTKLRKSCRSQTRRAPTDLVQVDP